MASSSPSSVQASSSRSWEYDVFISFRGQDTRNTFVDHLYSALQKQLIRVYKDDIALSRGESIGPSLLKSIEESKIAVIVFSKNYASSSWCLDELAYIMECRLERGLIVMPVFYDVDPSDVREQKNEFGKAFAKQEANNTTKAKSWIKPFGKQEANNTTKVESWRKALVDASNIAGWEPNNIASGHEQEVIKQIVDKIQDILFFSSSDVDEDLVGMKSRMQDLISRLEIGAGGVRMVGIWGIGGGGKTTLVSSVYKEIFHHFQGNCFVANIREESNKHEIKFLQQKVLSTVLKTEVEVHSVEEGKCIMKSRLRNRKVLLVLDDVDDLDQLQALAGSHIWFGSGSRIIITTRDEHLLSSYLVDHVYPVRLLSDQEAFQLLYKHAYNERDPISDYKTLSSCVVSHAAGLPLALKVLGSFLFDKDENEWRSALSKLKDIPDRTVMDVPKISYDGLEAYQKELFLDIGCFFRQQRTNLKDEMMEILDACGFHPDIWIKVLIEQAPINISGGKFDMRDLVEDPGHYIVRGKHLNNPEKHIRVWKDEDIRNMSFGDITKENHKIDAIKDDGHLSPLFISTMMKLSWLVMYSDDSAEGASFLSNASSHFDWMGYPASLLPESFQPMNLPKLDGSLPKGYKKLKLNGRDELEEIHPSPGKHRTRKNISVSYCDKLIVFPKIVLAKEHSRSHKVDRLIQIYEDHEALERGYYIDQSLSKAIKESQIAIIVFSKNYADSSWCLDVLAYIMKCRDEIGLTVIPIFYDVDPSQVRKLEGIFGEAFAKQEAKLLMKVAKLRKVRDKASNIAGWITKHIARVEMWRKALLDASNAGQNGHETKIKQIVEKIQDRLFPLDSDVDEDLAGVRECLQDLTSQLEIRRGGMHTIRIRGIGGSDCKIGTFDLCIKPKKKVRVVACDRRTKMLEKVMKAETLETFLEALGLGKYSLIFRSEEYDMRALLHVTERDLVRLGIPVGPGGSILEALKYKA